MSLSKLSDNPIIDGPRSTKCIMSNRNYVDSPSDTKKAMNLRWIFYKKYDPYPFVLAHNSSYWPWQAISIADKLSMVKGHKMNFKSGDSGTFRASLVKIVSPQEVDKFLKGVTHKIADANGSLSDISSIALVNLFKYLI